MWRLNELICIKCWEQCLLYGEYPIKFVHKIWPFLNILWQRLKLLHSCPLQTLSQWLVRRAGMTSCYAVLLHWLLTRVRRNLATFVLYPLPPYLPSLSASDLVSQQQLAALSYWHIVSCFWVFIFLPLSTVSFSFFSSLPGTLFFIPWDPGSLSLPPLCLWGHLCHYSYLFVIISIPHQSKVLKAAHLCFAFLLPPRVAGTEQTFNIYLSSILGGVSSPVGDGFRNGFEPDLSVRAWRCLQEKPDFLQFLHTGLASCWSEVSPGFLSLFRPTLTLWPWANHTISWDLVSISEWWRGDLSNVQGSFEFWLFGW